MGFYSRKKKKDSTFVRGTHYLQLIVDDARSRSSRRGSKKISKKRKHGMKLNLIPKTILAYRKIVLTRSHQLFNKTHAHTKFE